MTEYTELNTERKSPMSQEIKTFKVSVRSTYDNRIGLVIPVVLEKLKEPSEYTDPVLRQLQGEEETEEKVARMMIFLDDINSYLEHDDLNCTQITFKEHQTIMTALKFEQFDSLYWNAQNYAKSMVFPTDEDVENGLE
jgi:hypothetical protein